MNKWMVRWRRASAYRVPMQIRRYLRHGSGDAYPLCPRCEKPMEREFVCFCDKCGQRLGWDRLNQARFIQAGDRARKDTTS